MAKPFRISPETLEQADLLDGVEGAARERLSAALQMVAADYRLALDQLHASRRRPPGPPAPLGELSETAAIVLRASQEAADLGCRVAREEADGLRAAAARELAAEQDLVDQHARAAAERIEQLDGKAVARRTAAQVEVQRLLADARERTAQELGAVLEVQEALRSQVIEASAQLRVALEMVRGSDR